MITDVVISMGGDILKKKKWLPICIMGASFSAVYFFKVNVLIIILACGLIGALSNWFDGRAKK